MSRMMLPQAGVKSKGNGSIETENGNWRNKDERRLERM